MTQQQITFISDSLKLAGNFVSPISQTGLPAVLFLHGAGHATKERYFDWQNILANNGIASLSFDFRGCGESEGVFEDGSLAKRLEDAKNALEFIQTIEQVDKNKLILAGNSMGAHIAVRLTESVSNIKALMLSCPAAYSAEAENKPLNDEFSQVIRQENSWVDSPVFTLLEKFNGKVMVNFGEFDTVIPDDVKNNLQAICQRKGGQYLVLKGATHFLLKPENEVQEVARQKLFSASIKFIHANV